MAIYQARDSSNLPLTPPDSGSGYAYANMHYPQDSYAAMHHRTDRAFEYHQQHSYAPPTAAYAPAYQQSMYQPVPTTLPSISSYYEPVGAPILPPIRVQENASYNKDFGMQYEYPAESRPVKEEKATGGVSAKLDYDMDRMTDFVASATHQLHELHLSPICMADIDITRTFQSNASSPPAFRKWVHQVLSATRLPSATILLSLHYLSDRLKIFPGSIPHGENQIYRLLSVALILGSKFLDDNTFINRSWSDVTAIKVAELNLLELKWLTLIEYNLHIDVSCLTPWMDVWSKYDAERSRMIRLSPLDTNMARRHESTRNRFSPYPSPYSSSTMAHRSFDAPVQRSTQYNSYSAVDPWAPTERPSNYEDYYKRAADIHRHPTLSDIDDANRRAAAEQQFQARYPQSYHAYQNLTSAGSYSAAAAPGYVPWDNYNWNSMHRSDCTCSHCAYRAWRPYGYNVGTVAG